jgi:hypothetical protein
MGLYAVSRLAARHGIRVKLRPGTPQGLSALVWLPGHLATNEPVPPGGTHPRTTDLGRGPSEQLLAAARHGSGRHHRSGLATSGEQPALAGRGTPAGRPGTVWFTAKRPSSGPVKSPEETTSGWQSTPNGRTTAAALAGTGPRAAGDFAAASELPGPSTSAQTTSGLPQRVPGRNSFPTTDTPGSGIPAAAGAAPLLGAPPKAPDGQQHDQAPPRRRSAEVARSRLSGFQLGNRDAMQPDQGASWGQHAGEENGR